MQPSGELDIDLLLAEAGSFHAFQYKYIALLGVPWVVCGCLTMVHIFVAIPPAVAPECPLPLNISAAPLPGAASSLMIEWGLLCGREHEADALESAFMAGMLFGAGIIGNLADQFGRRPALKMCACGAFVGAVWSALAAEYFSYLCSRAVSGFFVAGLGLVCFVHTSEVLGQDRRVILVVSGTVLFAVGVAMLSKVAFILRQNWRLVHWAVALMSGLLLGMLPLVRESPRWLSAAGRRKQALEVLRHIADYNDRVLYSDPERPAAALPHHAVVNDARMSPSGSGPESGDRREHVQADRLVGSGGLQRSRDGGCGAEDAATGEGEGAWGGGVGDWQVSSPREEGVADRGEGMSSVAGAEGTRLAIASGKNTYSAGGGSVGAPTSDAVLVVSHGEGARIAGRNGGSPGRGDGEGAKVQAIDHLRARREDGCNGRVGGDGGAQSAEEVGPGNAYAELWVLKVRLLASMLLWFACSFGYYGLSLSVGALGVSKPIDRHVALLCMVQRHP